MNRLLLFISRARHLHASLELVALAVDERPILGLPVVLYGRARQAAAGDAAIVLVCPWDAVFLAQLCPLSLGQPAAYQYQCLPPNVLPKLPGHAEARPGTEGERTPKRSLSNTDGSRMSCNPG